MKSFLISPKRSVCATALLSAALVLGCAGRPGPDYPSASSNDNRHVRLTIQNNDFKDASIYVIWFIGSGRNRVGLATGKTSKTFIVEWKNDVVQFQADFIAGGTVTFEPIQVNRGDHLDLILMNEG